MTRRHPHVFGDQPVSSAAEALARWEAIKESEGGGARRSVLAGVPRALPALHRAQRVQHKAARVGFDWPEAGAALEKVQEEVGEVADALREGSGEALRGEIGDLLFAVVNVARLAGVDPEGALHGTVERFSRRFASMEEAVRGEGRELSGLALDELERLWTRAKALEKPS
jgi:tetrapyrrole methylase family protein/MazG family protein